VADAILLRLAVAVVMSQYAAFRRVPVPQQYAQNLRSTVIPAPTRGIVQDENEAFMQPGAAIVQDNWVPTMRGLKLRGGTIRWCVLPETTPVISAFEYASGNVAKMFAANATKVYDVTTSTPLLVKSGQTSGNYVAAQLANAAGDFLTAANDKGDALLRFDGTTWTTLNGGQITGPVGSTVVAGLNLTYVWKYRNRLFFIEGNSMNAYYLGIDAVTGALSKIPLSGAAKKGGKLLFGATWSLDAGDGIDEKCCFFTDQGEVLIFTGTDPSNASNWRQEGRYDLSPPMGMNAHIQVGGDLLILTVDGIVPLAQAITKGAGQLELAMVTRTIKPMWRDEVLAKRASPWTIKKWDEYGGIFITWPGGLAGNRYALGMNNATGAFCRMFGWDATCFIRLRGDFFFGTQGGIIMQAERTGYDDGVPYVATVVGGWNVFQTGTGQAVWHQARAIFTATNAEPFVPQLDATVDYVVTIPTPPPPGPDPGLLDVWDQGLWDQAKWDQPSAARASFRNTLWVSIGKSGFSHAPIVQVTVAQSATPNVELIAIGATFEPAGVNV
jgi:hypothetical protein